MGSPERDGGTTAEDPVDAPVRYRREPGCVHRWIRGSVLVGAPGRQVQRLDGAAAAVWAVLDTPGGRAELAGRIRKRWPAVDPRGSYMEDALRLLRDASLLTTDDDAGRVPRS